MARSDVITTKIASKKREQDLERNATEMNLEKNAKDVER